MRNRSAFDKSFDKNIDRKIAHIFGSIALGLTVVLSAMLLLLALPAEETSAQGPDEAHVIVQFGDNDVVVRHINFSAPISGYEALRLTSLDIITKDFGALGISICGIEGVGDSADNCFTSGFWSSYYWNGISWTTYLVGASDSVINDGAVELWSWQAGFVPLDPLPYAPPITAASAALEWLKSQQSSVNGSYSNDVGSSLETMFAIGANKFDALDWRRQAGSPSLFGYVLGNGASFANEDPAGAGKLAVGLATTGGCWPIGAMEPTDYYSPTTGAFSSSSGRQAWAILGMRALSQTVPATATGYLKSLVQSNGGWEWQPGWGADTNSTALAIQALVAAGEPVTSSTIISALSYLKSAQNEDGGFTYSPGSLFGTDTNSTAYVVQALLAAGEDPLTGTWVVTNSNPISYLLSMQLLDGSFEWQPGSGFSLFATQQAVAALLGRPYPLNIAELQQCSAAWLPIILKN